MDKISDKNISVIVQGAYLGQKTVDCVNSIRKYLPKAEIILSTWKESKIGDINVDKILLNDDPGSSGFIRRYPQKQINNVNRQIVSTLNGINIASREYCLKIRSDMIIENDRFLKFYNVFKDTVVETSIFHNRVMVEGLTTSDLVSFSVGDWWYFGCKSDLLLLFDIPLYKEAYIHDNKKYNTVICRYPPEQYIIYSCLKNFYNIDYQNWTEESNTTKILSKKFIFENLICIESELSGIVLPKARNMVNPVNYYYGTSFIKWYKYLSQKVNFPVLDKSLIYKLEFNRKKYFIKYMMNKDYYNIENEINIVKNYSSFKDKIDMPNNIVKENDLTFIVSGILNFKGKYNILKCLKSIRKYFPKSLIILSVWEIEDLSILEGLYDKIVLNKPIDSKTLYKIHLDKIKSDKKNSINLQQLCMNNALKFVETNYVVRIRSDFYFNNNNLLNVYNKWRKILNKSDRKYLILKERILTLRVVTRDARLINGEFAYQISDLFQIGTLQDIKKFWTGEFFDDNILNYFNKFKTKYKNPYYFNHLFTAEQCLLLRVLKNEKMNLAYPKFYLDNSKDEYIYESEKIYSANFIILSQNEIGLKSKFDESKKPFNSDEFFKLDRFLQIYLLNIDPNNEYCLKKIYKKARLKYVKRILSKYIKKFSLKVKNKIKNKVKNKIKKYIIKLYKYTSNIDKE